MTDSPTPARPAAASPTAPRTTGTPLTGPDLISVVTSVPGVHAIEPGLGTALRSLDARVRRTGAHTARFGLHIDTAEGTALVEVSLTRSRPIRETVRDIQLALQQALATQAGDDGPPAAVEVSVRVQSLQP